MYHMNSRLVLLFLFPVTAIFQFSEAPLHALGQEIVFQKGYGRRDLLSFKETIAGSNVTFECSPSGPCVPCLYSEKGDDKYRCSETGYRIPLKCVEIKDNLKDAKGKGSNAGELINLHHRSLLDDSTTSENGSQAYITYRSCIPPVNEEKLSVVGFEGIVLCLFMISGSIVYLRRKRTVSLSSFGAGRSQTNSRF